MAFRSESDLREHGGIFRFGADDLHPVIALFALRDYARMD
jgi:hypothetical protein